MRRVVLLGFALATGCDFVYDLHRDELPRVVGEYHHQYVQNDDAFAPAFFDEPFAPDDLELSVILDDGTRPEVTYNEDGTFWFERADVQPYRLTATAADVTMRYHLSSATPKLAHQFAGRPDAPPLARALIKVPYPEDGEAGVIMTTGQYSQSNTTMHGSAGTGAFTWNWQVAVPVGGRELGLLRAPDRIYAARFDSITMEPMVPYRTMIKVASATFDFIIGGTVTMPDLEVVDRSTCTRLTAANVAERDRLTAAAPRDYRAMNGDWSAQLVPAPDKVGMAGAMAIATSLPTAAPIDDLDVAPRIYDPFPGMTLVMQTGVLLSLRTALPGASEVGHLNYMRRYVGSERGTVVSTACSASAVTPPALAIPGRFVLGAQSISDAPTTFANGDTDLRLTWDIVSDGEVHYYTVQLIVLDNVGGATTLSSVDQTQVFQRETLIDHTLLEAGKTYMIVVTAQLGRPGVDQGDFTTVQLPFGSTQIWSYPFTVQ